jgi:hypothetical protein
MMEMSNALSSTQEREMTKKSKKRIRGKAPATLRDVAPVAAAQAKPSKTNAQSKVARVTEMVSKGCTLQEIVDRLGVSKVAAQSLIGDCRKKGVDIKSEKSPAGVNVFRSV